MDASLDRHGGYPAAWTDGEAFMLVGPNHVNVGDVDGVGLPDRPASSFGGSRVSAPVEVPEDIVERIRTVCLALLVLRADPDERKALLSIGHPFFASRGGRRLGVCTAIFPCGFGST